MEKPQQQGNGKEGTSHRESVSFSISFLVTNRAPPIHILFCSLCARMAFVLRTLLIISKRVAKLTWRYLDLSSTISIHPSSFVRCASTEDSYIYKFIY